MYSCQNYFAVYRIMYRIRALRYCFYCVYLTSYSTPPYILPLDKKQMNLLFCSRLIRIFALSYCRDAHSFVFHVRIVM